MRAIMASIPVVLVVGPIIGLTQHGEAGVIVVPLFAAIALAVFWRFRRITKATQQPARALVRLGAFAALVYLGLNALLATLQEWHIPLTPTTSVEAGFIGWGGLALIILAMFYAEMRKNASQYGLRPKATDRL